MASRRGVEFVDLATGENFQNHWVRSGCQLGDMPCNGLLYVAPHACVCYINAKLTGFNARARPDRRLFGVRRLVAAFGSVNHVAARQKQRPVAALQTQRPLA